MSFVQLVLIAIIQGITEWLPISSSAHVLLAADFFGATGRDEILINAVSNLGTLAAMLVYFRRDVAAAIAGGFELISAPFRGRDLSAGAKLALHIIVATPFALIAAVAYEALLTDEMKAPLRSVYSVAAATFVFGLLLWWADARGGKARGERDMTIWHAVLIGATQAIAAVLPGTSRSGITMTAARALGYARGEAARFSMLIGAPILAAAGLYGALGLIGNDNTGAGTLALSEGIIVAVFAFVSGLASIWALMAALRRMSFLPFVIYRIALAILLLATSPFVMRFIAG